MNREVSGCSSEHEALRRRRLIATSSSGSTSSTTCSMATSTKDARTVRDKLLSMPCLSTWIDLPLIVTMGATSSAKSSVLMNLSGIELPASSTLTTRCPIMLQMKTTTTAAAAAAPATATRRHARIHVVWKNDNDQNTSSYPPFEAQLNDDNDDNDWENTIPNMIAKAQQHILQYTQKDVARDMISVSITTIAATTTDDKNNNNNSRDDCLTLLDLPGWVCSKAENESDTLIEDVQSLLQEYVQQNRRRRCLILAVVPANVDFHNSHVLAEALKIDPTTSRTIPVITKPDLIDPGAEQDVVDLLMGQKLSFRLGFHMIKGRGQAALDQSMTIREGLEDEARFFDQVEPWKSIEDRTMFGTANLRDKLVELETQLIRQSIPEVLIEIRQKQQAVVKALEMMGDVLSSAFERRRYYQELCDKLVSLIQSSLTGKGRTVRTQPSAAANLHEAVAKFSETIREASLNTINTVTEGGRVLVMSPRGTVPGEVVHLDATFACVDFVNDTDAHSDALFEHVALQTEEIIDENEVWSDGSRVCIARKGNVFDVMRQIPLCNIRTDPLWLRDKIANNRTDDLACFLNIDVFKSIVADLIEDEWKPHCLALIESTRRFLLQAVEDSLQQTFDVNRYPELQLLVDQQCRTVVHDFTSTALMQALSNLELEQHPYTSLHDDLCQEIASERHSRLKRELEVSLRLDQKGIFETEAIKTNVDSVFQRNRQRSVEEHMAEEMELVLATYGTVATKRVLDRMPMICWEVFRALGSSISGTLRATTDETLQQCMEESSEFSQKHNQLHMELEELNKAIHMFESIA